MHLEENRLCDLGSVWIKGWHIRLIRKKTKEKQKKTNKKQTIGTYNLWSVIFFFGSGDGFIRADCLVIKVIGGLFSIKNK